MTRWQWTVDDGRAPAYDVVVDAEPDISIALVAAALGVDPGEFAHADPQAAAATAAPFSGQRVPPVPTPTTPQRAIRFRAGKLAGHAIPVVDGRVSIGRAPSNDVAIADPTVGRHHATLTIEGDQVELTPVDNEPLKVNGQAVTTARALGPLDLVEIGASVLTVGADEGEPADLHRDGSGLLAFNRPSRIRPRQVEDQVSVPGRRPQTSPKTPVPWVMALMPVLSAGALAGFTGQPTMLFVAAASPLMVLMSYRTQRRTSSQRDGASEQQWHDARDRARTDIAAIAETQRNRAWADAPDPSAVWSMCVDRDARLWQRRRIDPDALSLRVGVAEVAVPVVLQGNDQDDRDAMAPPRMSPVPVSVDLAEAGVLGVAGGADVTGYLGPWLVLQLAALRSPRDLRVVLFCDESDGPTWSWIRWLPHAQRERPGAPVALVGNDAATRTDRLRELVKEIEARQQAQAERRDVEFDEQVVVVIDGARRYRTLPGMTALLKDGPAVGVFSICLDADRTRLPEEVRAELAADRQDSALGLLDVAGHAQVPRLLIDGISPQLAETAARALAPLLHVGGDGDEATLPASVRLVDQLEVDLDDPDWVASRWVVGGRGTSAVVGAGLEGNFAVDLKVDGPHALVAGTTGAGKSEFLQTLVTSLALVNRPDALTFVLVDYKGASAFADCERLPHTVGMVTNLDNRETERALESLDAELKRREVVLKRLGAKDVDAAWEQDPTGAAANGLARLVLVIDEFAELVHELPTFVTGLIRIARVGRSLGVHLILATQRPSGVVSAEMQANVVCASPCEWPTRRIRAKSSAPALPPTSARPLRVADSCVAGRATPRPPSRVRGSPVVDPGS